MKLRYQIRTTALVNVVSDMKNKRLIPNAYFQRNLVWREIHKKEFVDTILSGFPFPQLFFSRGKIDVETMSSTSCIVDGQQRANAIIEYIDDKFSVNGKTFSQLNDFEKAEFLKYEIGIVELDLENDDPQIKEMFKRVNRTSNSLTAIEKLSSEYGATEFMVTAKLLCDELGGVKMNSETDAEDGLEVDPGIDDALFDWAMRQNPKNYQKLILEGGIFSLHEINRKIPLMYTLNIMSTIHNGFFRRNESSLRLLDDFKEQFKNKQAVVDLLDKSASTIIKMKLPKRTIWRSKANFFTLVVAVARKGGEIADPIQSGKNLLQFERVVPDDYALASKEAVNNRAERELRNDYVDPLLV